jgi:hypothetical protein
MIAYGNGKFFASNDATNLVYSTDDGATWTVLTNPLGTWIGAMAYGSGIHVAVGGGGTMAYSSDGTSWTVVTDSTFGASDITRIAYGNGIFVAVGDGGKIAYSSNGADWTAVTDSPFDGYIRIRGIAYGNGRFVAVGDDGKIAYCLW